ncbi:hypothetical protein RB195_002564 [Necator americanus]|uniref:Uncharacterized protein n=2 Tax=Necator americanus TaxID=51031 RepID=A0ABR1DJL5_NECAM
MEWCLKSEKVVAGRYHGADQGNSDCLRENVVDCILSAIKYCVLTVIPKRSELRTETVWLCLKCDPERRFNSSTSREGAWAAALRTQKKLKSPYFFPDYRDLIGQYGYVCTMWEYLGGEQMSSVSTVVGNVDETMKRPCNPEDSLCTDEFEIISSDTFENSAERPEDTVSQWSIQHNINVESLVPLNNLASVLCSTHSDVHSVTPATPNSSIKNVANAAETIPSLDPLNTLTEQSTMGIKYNETPVLAGTIEPLPSLVSSMVIDTPSLADSEATLENVLRSQSETREMLEKAIISLDTMNKERNEITAKLATINDLELEIKKLKSRVTELENENASLKKLERKYQQQKVEENCEDGHGDDDEHPLLKKTMEDLQQQLYDRGLEVDVRTKALAEATSELEAAYRKIADLTDSRDSAVLERIKISDKLDETYALLVAERERVSVTEDQLRSLQSTGGSGFNFSMVNEQAVVREMRAKADYAKLLESELENTRKKLDDLTRSCERKDVELKTHEEIINVLKEEDLEGRRVIAEKDRKISLLEEMVRNMGLDRAEVNNC